MSRGRSCPTCGYQMYHDEGAYNKCSNCQSVGWKSTHPTGPLGRGRGNTCPNCKKLTLHDVAIVDNKFLARRCTTCNYVLIETHDLDEI